MYWDIYKLYAKGSFDNIHYVNSVRYSFEILKKNHEPAFVGDAINCTCGRDPIVIRTLNDDVFGIKGTEAVLNLINLNNTLPLSTFYAEEDDTFKIVIKATYLDSGNVSQTKVIFNGFLVQEDCTEILTDITHEIRLTFTDNLGTLKNLPFGDAAKLSPTSAANLRTFTANVTVVSEFGPTGNYIGLNTFQTFGSPQVGDYVVLNDSPIGDAAYTIVKIDTVGAQKRLYVREKVLPFSNVNVNLAFVTGSNPYGRIKLSDLIRVCLHGTNLLLNFKFGNQAYAQTETQSIPYPLDLQIDGRTFLSGEDNWKSCYDVLQEICMRFQASLYQSDGVWFMTRWNELRYQDNEIIHTNYNTYITNQFTTDQYPANTIGQVEAGMEETILRPYNNYKETFKYNQPDGLFYNGALQLLGAKVGQSGATINGVNYQYNDYEAPGYNNLNPGLSGTYNILIRVTKLTSTLEEVDRYLLLTQTAGSVADAIAVFYSDGIEVNAGDRLKITFTSKQFLRTTDLDSEVPMLIRYGNGANDFDFVSNDAAVVADVNQYHIVPSSSYSPPSVTYIKLPFNKESKDYVIETGPLPRSGKFYFYMGNNNSGAFPADIKMYKNFKLEVINQFNARQVIKGQEHKGFINKIVKNNQNKEIAIDSTPKNSIYGTLFSSQFTNLVQNRVYTFRDGVSLWEGRLGELTTKQMMDWRYIQRIKLEGKLIGIYKASFEWLTLHQALIFSIKSGKYFIFGKAVYNLKEDFVEATLYEMWKDGEEIGPQGVATNNQLDYDFKFLY